MSLSDDLLKHRIFSMRLTQGQIAPIRRALARVEKLVARHLKSNNTPRVLVEQAIKKLLINGVTQSKQSLQEYANYEAIFNKKLIKKYFKKDIKSFIPNVNETKINLGIKTPRQEIAPVYRTFVDSKTTQLGQFLSDQALSTEPLANKQTLLANLIIGLMLVQAYSLQKTMLNAVAVDVIQGTQKANDIRKWQWVATLDNTCTYCLNKHEQIFNLGDEEPPAHINCACIMVPLNEI